MTHIKSVTMHGFKSFPGKTEIFFDKGINTIVGPNGSGKSNISDALCFALGRLSIKSMRAAKARNLLFMGSKLAKPAREAYVELALDNSKNTFNIPNPEVKLKRIVRHNGQSTYKINGETKTRTEVIETLAQAGIDPHGFNIILQGQIQSLIKAHPEERRKIIEEVAGISIYEARKEKSIKELEKTDTRLKEISTVLRERSAYLRNLESERTQALKYKDLEKTIKRCKASILNRKIEEKVKELTAIKKSLEEKFSQKDKTRSKIEDLQQKIESYNEKINQINKHIQQSTGVEQEKLNEAITNLKAELEGLRVRKENYENRRSEIENRVEQLETSIPEYESEIEELKTDSPKIAKKQEELQKKKTELSEIEEQKKSAYKLKTEFSSLKEKLKDRESQVTRIEAESDSLLKQIEEQSHGLKYQDEEACQKNIVKLRESLSLLKIDLETENKNELQNTKIISAAESRITEAKKIKGQIQDLDVCPLCQNKMTEEHSNHVNEDSDKKIKEAKAQITKAEKELSGISENKEKSQKNLQENESVLTNSERELSAYSIIKDKQNYLKKLLDQEKILKEEITALENSRDLLEKKSLDLTRIEEQYGSKILEIEEISSRTEKDLDTTLLYKQRELEKFREAIKQGKKGLEEIDSELTDLVSAVESKSENLGRKEEEEEKLNEKFKRSLNERDSLQEQIQKESYNLSTLQNESSQIEEQANFLKVGNAKIDAEKEALEMELTDYPGAELIKASFGVLQERLQKSQDAIQKIGSINMRALEVYDEIKGEYDRIYEKVETLQKEKHEILKIMEEIDNKKRRTFMKTFKGINELFGRNFTQLSTKGQAFLEIENKEDIFSGGINIVIKMQKGKHFDVTSLSGGEQTLIALSLLFAIQEHKPHHFYIFDEIDAALDKRNSERLSALLKKYIKAGQYIIVTHNDAIITDSSFLYGVSMHEGVSKILSLKLD